MRSAEPTLPPVRGRDIAIGVNCALALLYVCLHVYLFLVLPLWLLPHDVRWGWTVLPLALLHNPFWSLIHEAIHDLFHPRRRINLFFGRALSVLFGSPFRILRLSHLLHHKLNRTPLEGTEFYDRGRKSFASSAFGYYFQIFGGLYLVELLSPLLFFLPRRLVKKFNDRFVKPESVSGILMQSWTRDEAMREIRIDGALVLSAFGAVVYFYGGHWPLFAAALLARAVLISFLDNVYHYRTPVNDVLYARNLWLPNGLATALLHFNLHGIHHQNPAIPWIGLPVAFRQHSRRFQGSYFRAAIEQLGGPVALEDLPRRR